MEKTDLTARRDASDIVDLLGEAELKCVLKQCGVRADKLSHYELFRAFCEHETSLLGHRMKTQCTQILRDLLENAIPADRAHCDEIWQRTSDVLWFDQPSREQLCKPCVDQSQPDGVASLEHVAVCDRTRRLAANSLLNFRADSWEAWNAQIMARLERDVNSVDGILYRLPKHYVDRSPNPYAVTQTLKKNKRNLRDLSLLHAQLLRCLFAFCKERGVPLLLLSRCEDRYLASLLTRLHRDVGLPKLACAVSMPPPEWLLALTAEACEVTLAIDVTEDCAREGLHQTLARLSRIYPRGRITVIQ